MHHHASAPCLVRPEFGRGSIGPESEEPESGFVPGADSSRPGPDHHDRSIEAATFRKDASERPGHSLEEWGAGSKSHSRLAQVDGAVPHRLIRIEVPRHHDFDRNGVSDRFPAVEIRGPSCRVGRVILKHGFVEHGPKASADSRGRFDELRRKHPLERHLGRKNDLCGLREWTLSDSGASPRLAHKEGLICLVR